MLSTAQAIVGQAVDQLINFVNSSYSWVLGLRDKIIQVLAIFSPDNISLLLSIFVSWKSKVLAFFDNPLVFIFDLLEETVLDFLDYVLAWALGAVKYDLPKTPPWKK
jgi:hypothetical protein